MNALLAGLVGITASCNNVELDAAIAIGWSSALVYLLSKKAMVRWKIDDPIEASQIHGFTGVWGLIVVGLFDLDKGLIYSGSTD